jgi:hypothetical protein
MCAASSKARPQLPATPNHWPKLSTIDGTTFLNAATGLPYNQATIPMGPIATTTDGRFIEAYISAHLLNHEISFGKQDDWLGPGLGGGMAYSNNAEDIYSFRINRVEPLYIPLLSCLTGPFRYDFLVGSLRGHTGTELAIQALRECFREKKATMDELSEAAKVCRVANVMRPDMESLS